MKVLALDPGHGLDTAGKGVPGLREYDFNRAVAEHAAQLAVGQGFIVVLTQGLDAADSPLRDRVARAASGGADLLISIHADYNPSPEPRGHWVFYWHDYEPSWRLAHIWDRIASQKLPIPRRGLRASEPGTWTNFHMTREPPRQGIPSILIEHGFMSNPADLSYLKRDDYRKLCARAIVRAAVEFVGGTFRESLDPEPEVDAPPTWKTEAIDYLAGAGLLKDPEGWKERVDEPLPAWAVFILLQRIHRSGSLTQKPYPPSPDERRVT